MHYQRHTPMSDSLCCLTRVSRRVCGEILYVYDKSEGSNKPSINTVRIGPIEHKATKPKVFSLASFLGRALEKSIPIAIMNGTDIGPVVTPPESNAIGTISLLEIKIKAIRIK